MKKILIILLCLPMIFSSCKKEKTTTTNNGNNNSICPQNRSVTLDINGSSYYDHIDGVYNSADGNHNFCQYREPIAGEYVRKDVDCTLTFNSNGIIDLDINIASLSKAYFKIKINDIANKSINIQYPIIEDSDFELLSDQLFINYDEWFNQSGCKYTSYSGYITFSQIDLLPNNDINISANFELQAWHLYSQLNNNPAECTDTIYITNGVIQNLSVPEQFL